MINVSIETNIQEVFDDLDEIGLEIPNISLKILKKIVSKGRTYLRRAYRSSGLHNRTGALYKAIFGSAKKSTVGYFGILSKQAYKLVPLNYGSVLRPLNAKYLTFKIGDRWAKVESVTIPAHEFLSAGAKYLGSAEMNTDVDTVLDKEIKRVMKE
jgi:hypothetical protein